MNTKKNIDSLFEKEKNSTETPIFSGNEITSILGGERTIPFKNPKQKVSIMRISLVACSILAFSMSGYYFLKNGSSENLSEKKNTQQNIFKNTAEKPFKNEIDELYPNTQLQGISFLELTDKELAKMGITISESGITYYSNMRAQSAFEKNPLKKWPDSIIASKHIYTYEKEFFPPNEIVPFQHIKFSPRIISDGVGKTRMWWFGDDAPPELEARTDRKKIKRGLITQQEFDEAMEKIQKSAAQKYSNPNNLIPILIRAKESFPKNPKQQPFPWSRDFIFWYDATPEFIATLPERFKTTLAVEGRAMTSLALQTETAIEQVKPLPSPQEVLKEFKQKEKKVEVQEILIPETEKRETGDTYFDVWRSAAGAIVSSGIFPNPVKDQRATVKFVLKEDRNVIITLHDIYGRRIFELCKSTGCKSGEYSQEILLKDLQDGMYLIAIQTDKGEQAVQRVIVKKF